MALVKDILSYTPEQWQANQREIVERVVSGREYLGLGQEWVAEKAGYSITQYQRLENGDRFLEFEDFLRIGEVFYCHQESALPLYKRQVNKVILKLKCLPYRLLDWLEWLRGP